MFVSIEGEGEVQEVVVEEEGEQPLSLEEVVVGTCHLMEILKVEVVEV